MTHRTNLVLPDPCAAHAHESRPPPPNGPAKTGEKSGKGRGNNPPKGK